MFPELVLELKVTLFSLTLCVLLPEGETVSQRSTIKNKKKIKERNNKKMEHLKKKMKGSRTQRVIRSCPPTIRAGHDGKRLLIDTGSPEDFEHLSCPSFLFFFWLKNECCPVVFKGRKGSLFELPKHWIVLVLYFFFFCTLDSPW